MVEFGIVVVVATLFSLLVVHAHPMLAARWSIVKRSSAPPRSWPGSNGVRSLHGWYRDRRAVRAYASLAYGAVCAVLLVSAWPYRPRARSVGVHTELQYGFDSNDLDLIARNADPDTSALSTGSIRRS